MSKDYDNSQDNKHVVDLLSSYIDNALTSGERESVRAHLETCDSCRIEHDGLIGMKAMLKNLPVVPPPRAFTLTPEMVGAGVRRESFWQRLLTPRAVPRFATGSVVAFALLALLLVGDFMGMKRDAAFAPYATTGGTAAKENTRNSDVAVSAAPTTAAAEQGIALIPPAADATATTGASGTDLMYGTGSVDTALEATPETVNLASEAEGFPTVSVPDRFIETQSEPATEFYWSDAIDTMPFLELSLAAIGTLLAIGALIARRRGI